MKNSKGFTLIELMIVVAIIGILSAIAIPKFADLIRKSNEGATKGNLGAIRSAVSIYYGESEGVFPAATASGLSTVAGTLGAILTADGGKYIKEMPACYTPPHHAKLYTTLIEDTPTDTGEWGYQNAAPVAATDKLLGDVFVNCTQADSKTTVWSTY